MFQGPLKKKQGDEKCAYLMIWVGEKGRNVYSTWDMSAADQKKLDIYYENFEAYVIPKSNQVFSSYKFQCRLQKTNETCEEFVTDLKVLVKDCQYANPDRMVRDRIVFGTISSKKHEVEFYVANTKSQSVLGAATCSEVGLIKRVYTLEAKYSDLFTGLGCLPGIPGIHKIHVDDSSTPVVHPPRKVPVSLKGSIKTELDRMLRLGVIVRQKEPTAWVNSMVTVVMSNGDVRICIDPKDLNKAISREHYPMKTVEEVVANIPNAKVFSKIDATSGFWHLKLDEDSSKLTCFNTPFGRYRFLRAPFGIKSIPEIFQRVMTEIMENIEGAEVIVDDILIWESTIQEHDERLKKVLDRARQCNLKLSKSKCQF
ncbi:unnamed protein product [Mytilus coruscus]|uniref:Reverse transcriptase domain-containing protein n=1 Tax=Mytilus coruscus TaxID=42192 RepID=A0A6J8D7L9_MYTCO|nr:unnamed protein product [Mytilus coruscus]